MNPTPSPNRRDLLLKVLPACSLCLGCSRLGMAAALSQTPSAIPLSAKAAEKTDMTYEDLFKFAYVGMIPVMKNLAAQIGKDKFLEMLMKASSEAAARGVEAEYRDKPKRDLATWMADLKKPGPLYEHTLTYEILKDTEKEAEFRITECLWAKTFRQADAADIGYASICHGDIAAVLAFNPKLKMDRPKILMKGEDECRYHLVMET